jgi:glutathione reductase (NADPH)
VVLSTGERITAGTILVATGGSPSLHPSIPGQEHTITSNEIFDLPRFPKRLLIVGAGYIAVEFASVFARLGSTVTLALRGENVLRGFDEDLRIGLRDGLSEAGVVLRFACLPTKIDKRADGLAVTMSDGSVIAVDEVLVATGRVPHTRGLGLEKAGVELGPKGEVCVDELSRTNVPSIYAVGDVTDRVALTPVAIREGHAFADNVFGGKKIIVDHSKIATAVFTTPEIGTVGLTEEQARDFDSTMAVHPTAAEELVTLRTRRIRHERIEAVPAGPGMAPAK